MISPSRLAPSTLIDVIEQVRTAFELMGNATPISVGRQYLSEGCGSGPRVVFVPERSRGRIMPSYELGNTASQVHSCSVHVRAPETGDDIARFRTVYALQDLVIDCLKTAATGRIEFGDVTDDSPVDTDAYGAGLRFDFSYKRDIRHDSARWSLDPAPAEGTFANANPPPGIVASGATIVPTVTPPP
jgi:hypothetical protein